MKNTLLILTLAAAAGLSARGQTVGLNAKLSSAEPKSPKFKWVTLTTGTNVVASATNLQFTTATFYGVKAATNNAPPTANSAVVYVGYKDAAAEVTPSATAGIVDTLDAGGYLALPAPSGVKYNLTEFYFVGGTGDKVLIVYEQ